MNCPKHILNSTCSWFLWEGNDYLIVSFPNSRPFPYISLYQNFVLHSHDTWTCIELSFTETISIFSHFRGREWWWWWGWGGGNLTTLHGQTTSLSFFYLHHICNVLFTTHDISLATYNVGYINISLTWKILWVCLFFFVLKPHRL